MTWSSKGGRCKGCPEWAGALSYRAGLGHVYSDVRVTYIVTSGLGIS